MVTKTRRWSKEARAKAEEQRAAAASRCWKPVRQGTWFCSPACGTGCTWKAYRRAVAEAAALQKTLGPAWKTEVWENCGWHYRAQCAGLSVWPDTRGFHVSGNWKVYGWSSMQSESKTHYAATGFGPWTESKSYKTPILAAQGQLQYAAGKMRAWVDWLEESVVGVLPHVLQRAAARKAG